MKKEKYNISLEYSAVPESKKVLKKKGGGACQKIKGANLKDPANSQTKVEQF